MCIYPVCGLKQNNDSSSQPQQEPKYKEEKNNPAI